MDYIHIALFQSFKYLKSFYNTSVYSHIHTIKARWLIYKVPTSTSGTYTHQHTHTHTQSHTNETAIGSNLGFSFLPKDTSTCSPEGPCIQPPTFWLVEDLLFPIYLSSICGGISLRPQMSISRWHQRKSQRTTAVLGIHPLGNKYLY